MLTERRHLISSAILLQWLTIVWMVAEASIAIFSAIQAHSVSLLGFGLDSVVELISAAVVARRLYVEVRDGEEFDESVERRAALVAGALLFVLAAYVLIASILSFIHRSGEDFTLLGFLLTLVAFPVMIALGRRKRHLGAMLDSRALKADGAEAIACSYLSLTVLIGLAAQYVFGWWWIDAVASLGVIYFLIKEGREAFSDEDCCDD